jgi:hypothetical protein
VGARRSHSVQNEIAINLPPFFSFLLSNQISIKAKSATQIDREYPRKTAKRRKEKKKQENYEN